MSENKKKRPRSEDGGAAARAMDLAQLPSTATAGLNLFDARSDREQRLDLSQLQQPFDFEFLRTCCAAAPRVKQVCLESLVPVSRAYEENFLREHPEMRRCRMDADCEGMKLDSANAFILPEFLLPGQSPEDERRPCLLCQRHIISCAFYNEIAETVPTEERAEFNATLSPFFNIADVPGEYRLCDMLCAPGVSWPLSLPVVKHLRSAYEVSRQGGERLVKQVLYAKPEDPDAPAAFFRRGHSQTCAAK